MRPTLKGQPREVEMGPFLTDVVIHVNENLDDAGVCGVEREIRAHSGVISAAHHPGRNHLVVVTYDAAITRAASLLAPLKGRGFHAQLIGF
jgi:hypothetical protein